MQYLYDVHVHTKETSPCAKVPAEEVVKSYCNCGYDGIVITDHFIRWVLDKTGATTWEGKIDCFLEGYRRAKLAAEGTKLQVLLGMEIRFDDHPNDYLVYGLTERLLYDNPELYHMTLPKFYEFAGQHHLAVYQAHPFRVTITAASPEFLDGIEVHNGNPRHDSHNDRALAYAQKYHLRQISGSDFHQPEDLGCGGIYLDTQPEDSIALAKLLLSQDHEINLKTGK